MPFSPIVGSLPTNYGFPYTRFCYITVRKNSREPLQLAIKIAVSLAVILLATFAARRFPSVAGLIGVMPLTGAMVLAWVYLENQGDPGIMTGLAKGALWGMVPSILFFLVAFFCLKKGLPLCVVLLAGFAAWLLGAVVHQWLLK